ncbi:asparagine synthase (glutamine-hydrolyzing) [Rubrolithibacter danxiaensis]|uniref:asparagine synthase (glutamine-hydrolyzing) n=1 Tax=Rubrolithibacter danxiaensis TaxID=3390805 RepID=UPI003BF8DFFE
MCGIYGTTINYNLETVNSKLERINFRGPDYSAFKRVGNVILGHNRLSIIDLDPRSNQPFLYGHLWIVFNGEVYNYKDIQKDLVKKGYSFKTTSDTEVICAAYLEYGEECVIHFNGMFSFVIYDTEKKEFFGARDRFGKKPFYYSHINGTFEFASQPSQISIARDFTLDEQAISEYFIWNNIPEPRSIWKEVKKLPAGHSFIYRLNSDQLKIKKYWDLDYNWNNKFTGTYEEAKVTLEELLYDAVEIRLNADVPLGVFLSGGVDSSLVAALASQVKEKVKTFSVKFNEKGFDESEYAKQVAKHLHTEHHIIECNYNEGISFFENLSLYFDEPFADNSAIPSLLLSKYTRKHVTVALSGDGGDEGYLGYPRYKGINEKINVFRLPYKFRKFCASILGISPIKLHKLIAMGISFKNLETLYAKTFGGMENSWVIQKNLGLENMYSSALNNPNKPILEKISDYDIKTYLNWDINTKVDRASMAFSLETRAPLLDYRVIEFGRSLPTAFKFDAKGNQKKILKDILYKYVPKEIFNRPKAGFAMPFEVWFRNSLKEYVLDNLTEKELKNIPGINVKRTLEIIDEHMQGVRNRQPQIWKLLVLIQWIKSQKKEKAVAQHPLLKNIVCEIN